MSNVIEVVDGINVFADSLKEVTTGVLSNVIEYVQDANNFVVEQTPMLCNEIINFGLIKAGILMTVYFVTVVMCYFLGKKLINYMRAKEETIDWNSEDRSFFIFWGSVINYVGPLPFAIGLIIELINFAKIWFAPRLYILEYLTNLIDKM